MTLNNGEYNVINLFKPFEMKDDTFKNIRIFLRVKKIQIGILLLDPNFIVPTRDAS